MDLFFVVATAAVVVVSVLASVFLVFAIRLVRTAERLGSLVESEARALKGDLDDARLAARREAAAFLNLITSARKAVLRLIMARPPRD